MISNKEIHIKLSKIKMTLLFFGSIMIVALGLWLVFGSFESHSGSNSRYSFVKEPVFRFPAGLLCVVFCGIIAVIIFIKLFDRNPGLIINEKGIIDNSSGLSAGLVLWSEIQKIEIVTINNQKLIMFTLNNPYDYLNKVTNRMKRKAMEINYKWYGAPISISANSLQINFKDLYDLLSKKMEEHNEKSD